jgi:hypothetical protein
MTCRGGWGDPRSDPQEPAMPRRTTLAALFCLAAGPAAAAAVVPPPLLETLALWLGANYDLPAEAEPPALATLPDRQLAEMRYGPGARVAPGEVVAVYDDATRTIYLGEAWRGRTPAGISVLVHELVHHLQNAAGQRFACPGEREAVAYRAQDAWLALFDESLESAFGIDPGTIRVATACTH